MSLIKDLKAFVPPVFSRSAETRRRLADQDEKATANAETAHQTLLRKAEAGQLLRDMLAMPGWQWFEAQLRERHRMYMEQLTSQQFTDLVELARRQAQAKEVADLLRLIESSLREGEKAAQAIAANKGAT